MSRGRGRGGRNKRKISGNGNFDQNLKTPRYGGSPENGGNVSKSVSNALRSVRSVLYEWETDTYMNQMFYTPPRFRCLKTVRPLESREGNSKIHI